MAEKPQSGPPRRGKGTPPKKPTQKPATRGLPPHLVPGNPGNSGGKPGRSGRKPNAFVQSCEAATDEQVLPRVLDYLASSHPGDQAWRWCAEYVTSYSRSKAPTVAQQDVTVRAGVVVLPAPDAPIAIVEPSE